MPIILVRHGETALNAARVLQPADTPLSERGLRQAQAVAMRLVSAGATSILSSDLPRAMQTARAIAAATGVSVSNSALLQERNFGDLRGRAYDDLDFDPLAMQEAPPAGESVAQFEQRVTRALALACEHAAAESDGNLIVVTHGLVIRTLLQRCLALPSNTELPERIANTSLTIFLAEPPYRASLVNCTAHLSGELSDDVRALSGF
jgi:broad specificity phosphatase PhoE